MPFLTLLYELRKRKVRVGVQEALSFARALGEGLHDDSLAGLYHVARALCVHAESDLDAFDEAFAACFRGAERRPSAVPPEVEAWLSDPRARGALSAEQLASLDTLSLAEVERTLAERLREQTERHDGGSHWIGTGGTSPFGAGGQHPSGLRLGPEGGGRTAMGVADARAYRAYRSDVVLDVRQFEVALRKLRALAREGGAPELDVEATIDETARNGGELEVVTRPPRRPNVRVVLLMDVGGSMDPHAELASRLFSAARRASNFRELKTYYFHNCIYGNLYETESFRDVVPVRDLFAHCGPEWRLVLVGDAAMHPAELHGGAYGDAERMTGLRWMQLLADRFASRAWLNPDAPHHWRGGTAEVLAGLFPMFHLTLAGLGEAMAHLARRRAAG